MIERFASIILLLAAVLRDEFGFVARSRLGAPLNRMAMIIMQVLTFGWWLCRLCAAIPLALIAAGLVLGAFAVPIGSVQQVFSERARDAYMKRVVEAVVEFQDMHGRMPTPPETDAIAKATAEGETVQTFQVALADRINPMPPDGFRLEWLRGTQTESVDSWTRTGTIETSWLSHTDVLQFVPVLLGIALFFGAFAAGLMPPVHLRRGRISISK